jgi:hypothetical protein
MSSDGTISLVANAERIAAIADSRLLDYDDSHENLEMLIVEMDDGQRILFVDFQPESMLIASTRMRIKETANEGNCYRLANTLNSLSHQATFSFYKESWELKVQIAIPYDLVEAHEYDGVISSAFISLMKYIMVALDKDDDMLCLD